MADEKTNIGGQNKSFQPTADDIAALEEAKKKLAEINQEYKEKLEIANQILDVSERTKTILELEEKLEEDKLKTKENIFKIEQETSALKEAAAKRIKALEEESAKILANYTKQQSDINKALVEQGKIQKTALDEQKKLQDELAKLSADDKDRKKEIEKALKEQKKIVKETSEEIKTQRDILQSIKNEQAENENLKNNKKLQEDIKKELQDELSLLKKRAEFYEQGIKQQQKYEKAVTDAITTQENALKAEQQLIEANRKKANEFLKEFSNIKDMDMLVQKMRTLADVVNDTSKEGQLYAQILKEQVTKELIQLGVKSEQVTDNMIKGHLAAKAGAAGLKSFNDQLLHGVKAFGLFEQIGVNVTGAMEAFKDVTTGVRDSFVKFGYSTKEAQENIAKLRPELAALGVDEKMLQDATGNLRKNFTQFNELQVETQKDLIKTTALLSKMGIDSGVTAVAFSRLTTSMGYTDKEAKRAIEDFAKLGQVMGVGGKVLEDFNNLAPKLEVFGHKATKVFSDTAMAAKFLNIDTQELYNTMSQYDSFEKAADAAGELNLVLGGQFIDSLELMRNSIEGGPMDVLKQFNKAFKDSKVDVDALSPSMLKAAATAAGMGDNIKQFKEIAKFDTTQLESYMSKQKELVKQQESLEEATKNASDIFDELKNSFAAVFKDESFVGALKSFVTMISGIGKAIAWLIGGFDSMGLKLGLVSKAMIGFMTLFAVTKIVSFFKGIIDGAKAMAGLATGQTTATDSMRQSTQATNENTEANRRNAQSDRLQANASRMAQRAENGETDALIRGTSASRGQAQADISAANAKRTKDAATKTSIAGQTQEAAATGRSTAATATQTGGIWANVTGLWARFAASAPPVTTILAPILAATAIGAIVSLITGASSGSALEKTAPDISKTQISAQKVGQPTTEGNTFAAEDAQFAMPIEDGEMMSSIPQQSRVANPDIIKEANTSAKTFTTAAGNKVKPSGSDEVVAIKEGGILANKLDMMINVLQQILNKPSEVHMDGRKVTAALNESARYNPNKVSV